jgi:diguanylate cyclase (GGDEF)-like protein
MLEAWGYEVVLTHDGAEAWEALSGEGAPQLAILDWMMPRLDGLQVCKNVRNPDERPAEPYIYIILLTAKSQKTDMVTGLEAGADDYLTKPFDAQELRMRLRAGRRILDLLDELVRAREILREQARKDSLTQLCTRATVLELLKHELDRAQRHSSDAPVSVVLADLDHFKHINDTYGHLAGDAVLRETARRMRDAVRPYDSIGRYGGEEFLLVLSNCDSIGAAALAERLLQAVRKDTIVLAEGTVSVTLSAGVATSGVIQDPETLVGAADAALYRAKRGGRNRVEVATAADMKVG